MMNITTQGETQPPAAAHRVRAMTADDEHERDTSAWIAPDGTAYTGPDPTPTALALLADHGSPAAVTYAESDTSRITTGALTADGDGWLLVSAGRCTVAVHP